MIYLVTKRQELFEQEAYKIIGVEESLSLLEPLKIVGLDSETLGLDVFTGKLFLLQLGNKENQVVIDATTIDIKLYKEYLESDRLFILQNAKFDLRWLYKEGIVVKKVFDTYLAEKICFLGFPPGIVSLSLQANCERHLNVYVDKTVRGDIYKGQLTPEIIMYAATDVVYLEDLMNAQLEIIEKRGQLFALEIENRFVRVLAYIEFCGIRLDPERWKSKMEKDAIRLKEAEDKLNSWVIDYILSRNDSSMIEYNYYKSSKKSKATKYVAKSAPSLFDEFDTDYFCTINWSSPQQVIPLFEELGFNLLVKDKKSGKMKKSIESKIIEMQVKKSSIAPLYLDYSAAAKVVSAFGQNFIDNINPVTGRIHPNFNQMMDTGRLSCGSGSKKSNNSEEADVVEDNGVEENKKTKSVNIQQLPSNEETRSAFIPNRGNLLIDCDYGDQEGHIFTELSNDKAWIDFYNDPNERDGHSFVAKMCFPDVLDGVEEKDVKSVRKDLRALAKKARFCFNYNGQANTMATNCNIDIELAISIYNNYFTRFNGIANYFKSQKRDMWNKGYILISKQTGLRAYIYDWPMLKGVEKRINNTESFWDIYRISKDSKKLVSDIPTSVVHEICKRFSNNMQIDDIAARYSYTVKVGNKIETRYIDINKETVYITVVRHLFKRRSSSDNQSCNYPSQGTAAAMTKIAGINYFDHLIKDGLIFKVLIPNAVHDEYVIEPPAEIAEQEAKILSEYMEKAAKFFCKKVTIKAVPEIADHWVH